MGINKLYTPPDTLKSSQTRGNNLRAQMTGHLKNIIPAHGSDVLNPSKILTNIFMVLLFSFTEVIIYQSKIIHEILFICRFSLVRSINLP